MKRSIATLITCVLALASRRRLMRPATSAAIVLPTPSRSRPMARSRTDAAEAAAQVPGAAGVLLEALRWRGRTARQIGLPTKLWCADFMNFVLRQRRRQRHAIARGALVPAIRQEARRPARRRHRHHVPQGPQQRPCRRRARHRRPGQSDRRVRQSRPDGHGSRSIRRAKVIAYVMPPQLCARGHGRRRARRGRCKQ